MGMLLIDPQYVYQFRKHVTDDVFGDYVLIPQVCYDFESVLLPRRLVVSFLLRVELHEVYFEGFQSFVCYRFVLPAYHFLFSKKSTGTHFVERLHDLM